jgi:uncharacterized repeat protein (TIGR02543 family)
MESANVTLYARWAALPTYTVTYNGNGGTGTVPSDTNNYLTGASVTVIANTFSRSGYSFAGWYPAADGSGTVYGATFTMGSANVTLYANWTALPTYTVTAATDSNGTLDISTPSPQQVNSVSTVSFTFNANANYYIATVSGCGGTAYDNTSNSVTAYNYTSGTITEDCTVSATFAFNQPNVSCSDSGLPCIERTDGGDDWNNLVDGMPKVDLEYRFALQVFDKAGTPQNVRLYLAQRGNPSGTDFYPYDMTCGGDFMLGATCSYTTILGPAAVHKYYFEVKKFDGTVLTYPTSGYLSGPSVQMMDGYNMLGVPRDLSPTAPDGMTIFGSNDIYTWLSTGLTTDKNYGSYVLVGPVIPIASGEGYYVKRNAASTIAELEAYADVAAANYAVTLKPGWNIISDPYIGSVKLSNVQVQRGAEAPVAWSSAVGSGWLVNAIYYFNGSDWGSTFSFESAGGVPEATLIPWLGYWVYLGKDDNTYTLIINRP